MTALIIGLVVLFLVVVSGAGSLVARSRRRTRRTPGSTRPSAGRPPGSPSAAPSRASLEAPETLPDGSLEVLEPVDGVLQAPAETVSEVLPAPEELGAAPRIRDRLGKARTVFAGYVGGLRARGRIDEETWDELEEALLRADVGVAATTALLDDLRALVTAGTVADADALLDALRSLLVEVLEATAAPGAEHGGDPRSLVVSDDPESTTVWLFVGVNGVGKTTTVGKVARREQGAGRSVLLAAGDTFRAAAGEQLAQWAARTGAEIVRGAEGGDPSAIVFDAVQRARARGNDLVLADTAGRLHTKVNLIEELKKIRRVADRPPGRVCEVLLVLDATTGQNAIAQARQFGEAVGVTGVVLTKLDGTAKGGVVVAIQRELGVPVKLVGLGEGPDDLVPFEPAAFVDALLS